MGTESEKSEKKVDTYIGIIDSLCCTEETNTTL